MLTCITARDAHNSHSAHCVHRIPLAHTDGYGSARVWKYCMATCMPKDIILYICIHVGYRLALVKE